MSSTNYTHGMEFNFVAGDNCIEMPAPARGDIRRLIAVVDSGGGSITSLTIYDRKDACDGNEQSFNPDDGTKLLNPKVHQVTPTLTPTAGVIEEYERNWAYQNRDEQKIHGRMETRLWGKLVASGTGTLHLAYTVAVQEPIT